MNAAPDRSRQYLSNISSLVHPTYPVRTKCNTATNASVGLKKSRAQVMKKFHLQAAMPSRPVVFPKIAVLLPKIERDRNAYSIHMGGCGPIKVFTLVIGLYFDMSAYRNEAAEGIVYLAPLALINFIEPFSSGIWRQLKATKLNRFWNVRRFL